MCHEHTRGEAFEDVHTKDFQLSLSFCVHVLCLMLPGGETLLWHYRWKVTARAARLGYNVMSVDTDTIFFRDPYVHLHRPPLNQLNVSPLRASVCISKPLLMMMPACGMTTYVPSETARLQCRYSLGHEHMQHITLLIHSLHVHSRTIIHACG